MKIIIKILCCLALLATLLTNQLAFAADASDIKAGERFEIDSKVLGEKRTIMVALPESYAKSQARFPVLYLTDGETHFFHTAGTVDFLAGAGRAPAMIVVGVTNTDRNRDLSPTPSKEAGFETAGGADKFLKFFEEELIPTINQRYRSAPYKVFAGHSLGGLLAVHSYLSRPGLFDAYIAVSPSLWWDDKLMLKRAEAQFAKHKAQGVLFMSLGDEDKDIEVMTWNTKTWPTSANTYVSLCEVLANAGKLPEAKAQCEQAVRIGQENKDPVLPEYKKPGAYC